MGAAAQLSHLQQQQGTRSSPSPAVQGYARDMDSHGVPKGKTYGDLAAAMRGVRKSPPSVHIQTPFSAQGQPVGFAPAYGGAAGAGMRGGGRFGGGGSSSPPPPPPPAKSPQRKSMNYVGGGGGGRVVSRSGADIADQMHFPRDNDGMRYSQPQLSSGGNGWTRRRDVSGKVAEEGRGGDGGYAGGGWFR